MSYTIKGALTLNKKPALDYDGKNFTLVVPYGLKTDRLKDEVQVTWDKRRGLWVLPDLTLYAHSALEVFPDLPLTKAAHQRLTIDPAELELNRALTKISKQDRIVFDQLYSFQRDSVARLILGRKRNQQVVLSPGLGKTVVSLLGARILGLKSVLIVCIKDLIRQWQDEEEKWFGERTLVKLHGEAPRPGPGWYITNYDTVVGGSRRIKRKGGRPLFVAGPRFRAFADHGWDAVVVDESVLIKNRDTLRFDSLLNLRHKDVTRVWELSGSPSTRYPDDLWAQMHLLYPESFRSYWRFAKRFCTTEENEWVVGSVVTGTRLDRDTKVDLADLQLVRSQKDVLKDLPEEIPVLVPIELTPAQRKAYSEMSARFVTELESGKKVKATIVLSQLIRLQQLASNLINVGGEDVSAKADALTTMLEARSFALPALIWTLWVPGAGALLNRLRKAAPELKIDWVHGAASKKEEAHNESTLSAYKAGKLDILILSLQVGRFGQNLQRTQSMIYVEKSWAADDFVQSIHRVLRIGLDHRPIIVTLKAINTVDEMVEQNIAGKLPAISSISSADLSQRLRILTGEVDADR